MQHSTSIFTQYSLERMKDKIYNIIEKSLPCLVGVLILSVIVLYFYVAYMILGIIWNIIVEIIKTIFV